MLVEQLLINIVSEAEFYSAVLFQALIPFLLFLKTSLGLVTN